MFPRQFRVEIDPGRITSSVWNEGRSNMNATSLELSNRLIDNYESGKRSIRRNGKGY